MKHPEFYNVRINNTEGDYGCTHTQDEPVRIIVSIPKDDDFLHPVIDHTIEELVELIAKSKEKA